MREKNKIKIKLSIYLLFLVSILFIGLNYEKNIKIDDFLEKQKNMHLTIYNNVYNDHKEQAHITYELLINNQQIKDIYALLQNATSEEKDIQRDNLYQIIKDKYKILKSFNIRQLHFHLKDNESFLRMHKVKKYGDNLTLIRPTVAFVNKYHKKVDGFEEGRIYNGYRFVFPIKNKNNKHLGSIEISYNANTFVKHIANSYNFSSNILVNKNVVDEKVFNSEKSNYIKSPYKGYYFDKKILEYKKSTITEFNINKFNNSQVMKDKGLKSIKGGKNITLYDNGKIITYIAIKNPITKDTVAFFIIKDNDNFIKSKILNFNITFTVISILLLIVFYFL
ncbi:MAG: hypothetical protein KAJ49_06655, partial [Arcobacteraceae bacterium]|nr:hypothetical protein [Arcobacteraceae bacterium]